LEDLLDCKTPFLADEDRLSLDIALWLMAREERVRAVVAAMEANDPDPSNSYDVRIAHAVEELVAWERANPKPE